MYYSDEVIEEVRSRTDIVDLISGYVHLTRKGSNHMGLCPFHNEKSPSFSVSQSKQMYYCFGCGAGGNIFTFLMEYEGLSFPEAVKTLAAKAGVELPEAEYTPEAKKNKKEKQILLDINKQAAGFYYYQLRKQAGEQAYQYLKGRRLSDETIKRFGLGYSVPQWDILYRYLRSKGFEDQDLRNSGLFNVDENRRGMRDKFYNRVIFPIMDPSNRVIGFGGRVMGDGKPKYLNSPETKIFDKGRNLYGLNIARSSRKNQLILCEGYMDVISMHQAGFNQAVASLGTAFTSGHASLIKRYCQEALLLYDSDEAGIRAALRAIPILKEAGIASRVVDLKPYKDPDEFIKAEGAEAFQQRLDQAMDSFMFRIRVLEGQFSMSDPQGLNRFFEQCAAYLVGLEDELERSLYLDAVAKKYAHLGITRENLQKRVRVQAMRGMTQEPRQPRNETESVQKKKKDTGSEKAQKLMLTWMSGDARITKAVSKYLKAEDFTEESYRRAASMLFEEAKESGTVTPARILNAFEDSEEQRKVAALFHAQIHLESEQEQDKAFADTLIRIREDSMNAWLSGSDTGDVNLFMESIRLRKELEELKRGRNRIKWPLRSGE